jgi:hypothetical protein
MPITDLPGHEEVFAKFAKCGFSDFNELQQLNLDTYYEEDRERFEKQLTIILKGQRGLIELSFGNVSGFRLSDIFQIIGFDVKNIRKDGLEEKHYKISDYENGTIEGYAENAKISVCDNPYV